MTATAGVTQSAELTERLNWLRAGVLGANDGVVSVAATVVGVAAATSSVTPVLLAGVATMIAGIISMALGEYVSVSSAADTQRAIIARVRNELLAQPREAEESLAQAIRERGISPATAQQVAAELSLHDALDAQLTERYHLDEAEVVNPWQAAAASGLAFFAGAALPLATILWAPVAWRIPVTAVAVLVALAVTGGIGARLGQAPIPRAVARVVIGGAIALAVTYLVGTWLGVNVA
ncbi:MAG: VIT1/CCC1 transporter family protein [Arachnia sp.]